MSWGWYWKCKKCSSTEDFLKELWKSNDIKTRAKSLVKSILEEAVPYNDVEIFSNRPLQNRRCKNCNRWHVEKDPVWKKSGCTVHIPFEERKCQNCGYKKELLFIDKESVIFIEKVFCYPQKHPPSIDEGGIYNPFFYYGLRYEKNDHNGGEIISAVYFMGKNGNNYGRYSPYFYFDKSFIEEFGVWLKILIQQA